MCKIKKKRHLVVCESVTVALTEIQRVTSRCEHMLCDESSLLCY